MRKNNSTANPKETPINDKVVIRKISHTSNHLFSNEYLYDGEYTVETKILLTQYNKDILEWKHIPSDTNSFNEWIRPDCMNWLQITGLNDTRIISKILADFNLHCVDTKAILTPCHSAKIDFNPERLLIVMRPCFFEKKNEITSEHICIVSKDNLVITFRERGELSFDNVSRGLRMRTMNIREQGRGMLVAFILNALLSVMIGTAIRVEEILESIDNMLLDSNISNTNIGRKIQQCSHANLILQKNSIPLKDEFSKLVKNDLVKNDAYLLPVYGELYNQLDFIVVTAGNSKELLTSMRDLYVSNNELKTNAIMKRLTIVSTLFIPITFLVGVWGMNFSLMPETEWKYGYILAWIILVTTVSVTWYYMKKNKWF